MQKNFFPAFGGAGNVCSGVEISDTATPNGCGCKPNDSSPCTYNSGLQGSFDDQCYLCTTADLVAGVCPNCIECLTSCDSCIAVHGSVDDLKKCLKKMSEPCRASCDSSCKKN